jgi:pyridoxal 5'-phosphate synthase pdxT subunit
LQIGVIALQGDVSEHVDAMKKALKGEGSVVIIRRAGTVRDCNGLVLPGGESTTICRQLELSGIAAEIIEAASVGKPVLATCAGLVLAAREIKDNSLVKPLGLMDIKIGRNIFGPQRDSFEADLKVKGFNKPYRAVFIRAPGIVEAGSKVEILAYVGETIVAARQGNMLGLAFHPELTDDLRFHQVFLEMIG